MKEMVTIIPLGSCPKCGHRQFVVSEHQINEYLTNGDGEIIDSLDVEYDADKLREMKNKMYKLPPDQFYKFFTNEKGMKAIIEYYSDRIKGMVDPDAIKDDVTALYDALYENFDEILKDYA